MPKVTSSAVSPPTSPKISSAVLPLSCRTKSGSRQSRRHQYHWLPLQKQGQVFRIFEKETTHEPQKSLCPLSRTLQDFLEDCQRHAAPQNFERRWGTGKAQSFRRRSRALWHKEERSCPRCPQSRQIIQFQKVLHLGRALKRSWLGKACPGRKIGKQTQGACFPFPQEAYRCSKRRPKGFELEVDQRGAGRAGLFRVLICMVDGSNINIKIEYL